MWSKCMSEQGEQTRKRPSNQRVDSIVIQNRVHRYQTLVHLEVELFLALHWGVFRYESVPDLKDSVIQLLNINFYYS